MAGIYIHIPYCKQRCSYCDFHFSTILKTQEAMVKAIIKELILRKSYIAGEKIETIYFGGGTPSILSNDSMEKILKAIFFHYSIIEDAEITLEANPDDLTYNKIKFLSDSPINRLSIGVQSFFDDELQFMRRTHSARQAVKSIEQAKREGFDNITIDLIYGIPGMNHWKENIAFFLDLSLCHLSSYALTVEKKTLLNHWLKIKKVSEINEEQQQEYYNFAVNTLSRHDFEPYEVSNFAKNKNYSKHNTNYWKGRPYIGIGPAAHSYNGTSRQWNISNNIKYIKAIEQNTIPLEIEKLESREKYNEWIMLGLRTMWGIDLKKIKSLGVIYVKYLLEQSEPYQADGKMIFDGLFLKLNPQYRFFADGIAADLFFI